MVPDQAYCQSGCNIKVERSFQGYTVEIASGFNATDV